jgi:hypothetical protein
MLMIWLHSMSQGGGRGLNRYIKKKSLDPLDTYVPPVLQARQQLQKSGDIMGACSHAPAAQCQSLTKEEAVPVCGFLRQTS